MTAIRLTPTERRAVIRAARDIDNENYYSCLVLKNTGGYDLYKKYGEFFDKDPNHWWFHETLTTRLVPTQNERVLMLLLFAEACK